MESRLMFKNMKLGTKIGMGFSALLVIAIALGALAVVNMNGVKVTARMLATEIMPEVGLATEVERSALKTMYAARGWGDGLAGALHVVGAIAYGFVILRVAFWLPARSRLTAALVFVGVIGCVGNAAYGFEAIHMSVGDLQLVDRAGPANIIKPIGLFFPLSLALAAWALARLGHRWQSWLLGVAVVAWPVAHIGNLPPVAVAVNVALVAVFGSIARGLRRS